MVYSNSIERTKALPDFSSKTSRIHAPLTAAFKPISAPHTCARAESNRSLIGNRHVTKEHHFVQLKETTVKIKNGQNKWSRHVLYFQKRSTPLKHTDCERSELAY